MQSTINAFGISLFRQPEEFIAVFLGMKTHTESFLTHIERLLHRTKSPPLAITYTYHFLKDKTEEELSLDVIRFVSQLADVSPGVSMSSSLQGILSEGSFLTELRHSLTHKTMVKGTILLLGRRLILEELEMKFWVVSCDKIKQTYRLNLDKIKAYFLQIFKENYEDDLEWLVERYQLKYFVECSNYQYKEHISVIIQDFMQCKLNSQQFHSFFQKVTVHKQVIFLVLILQSYLQSASIAQHFSHYVLKLVQNITDQMFEHELVRREFLKSYFLRYLQHANNLYMGLPVRLRTEVERYWAEKEREVGRIF